MRPHSLYPRIEGREVDDVIVACARTSSRSPGVDAAADPAVAEAVRRITHALLHAPTVRAREAAQSGELERYRSALETVFGIPVGSHGAGDEHRRCGVTGVAPARHAVQRPRARPVRPHRRRAAGRRDAASSSCR